MSYVTPEKNKEKKKRYFDSFTNDLDKALRYHFYQSRTGAKKRGITFDLTLSDYKILYEQQQGLCALSDMKMSLMPGQGYVNRLKLSTDRIDNNKGYIKGNIQFITWQANQAKNIWSNDQLIDMCRNIVKKQSILLGSK
jgi:hypothetical protein